MRRLALLLFVLPLSVYAYACSSDDSSTPSTEEDSGTGPGNDSGGPIDDDSGNTPVDSGNDSSTTDGGTDAGDGGDGGDAGDGGVCTNPLADAPDGGTTIAAATLKAIAVGNFPDGPQYVDINDAGTILFSQVFDNTVFRLQGDGGGAQAVFRNTPNLAIGNAVLGNTVFTASPILAGAGGQITRTLVDGGTDAGWPTSNTSSPNDLAAGAKYLYVTDPRYQDNGGQAGSVFRLDPADGGVLTITLPANNDTPDGIALSPDGTSLYVSISGTFAAAQRKILKYSVDAQGVATNPAAVPFVPTELPVGLAVDASGNIWIAEDTDGANTGRVEVITPAGKKWGEITFADSRPTGIAFGGADNKTVYITAERGTNTPGTLYMFSSRCAGVR